MSKYPARTVQINAATVAAIQTVFARSRLSHQAWKSRRLEGRVDGRNVHRYEATGKIDIFRDRKGQSPTKVNLWLLVDASGSMNGNKAEHSADISATLVEAFKRIPSVRLHVWQHDFQYSDHSVRLFKVYETGMSIAGFATMHGNGLEGNADGFALQAVGDRALADTRRDEQCLILVISDGAPTDHGIGATNRDLIQHSWTVSERLRQRGARVLCVAIEAYTSYAYTMYGKDNVVPFNYGKPTAWEELARGFGALLGKTLQQAAGH